MDWWADVLPPFVQVEQIEGVEEGLFADAQRFFVLTQTDNMWKEHLQVCMSGQEQLPCMLAPLGTMAAHPGMVPHEGQCLA